MAYMNSQIRKSSNPIKRMQIKEKLQKTSGQQIEKAY
jgi:hypothetical protein